MAKNSLPDKTGTVKQYVPTQFDNGFPDPKSGEAKLQQLKKQESEGFEKGYAEGVQRGLLAGQNEIGERLARLDSIIRELEGLKDRKIDELLPEIVELSLDMAKKIIHKKIEQDREIIVSVVREAVRKLGGREEKMTIRVNPADYDTMLSSLDVLKEDTRLNEITIEPSASVSPGGCYIETRTGEVDARIEEQIREIHDAISTALDS